MTSRIPLSIACTPIIDALFYEIRGQMRGYENLVAVDTAPLEAALAQQILCDDPARQFKSKPPAGLPDNARNFVQAYLDAVQGNDKTRASQGQEPLGALALRYDDFDEMHQATMGDAFVDAGRLVVAENESLIDFAARRAWHSYIKMERVAFALSFVMRAVPQQTSFASKTAQSIREELNSRSSQYLGDYTRMSLMSSDKQVANIARKRLFAETYQERFWLSGYIAESRYQQSHLGADKEDAFRQELRVAAGGR